MLWNFIHVAHWKSGRRELRPNLTCMDEKATMKDSLVTSFYLQFHQLENKKKIVETHEQKHQLYFHSWYLSRSLWCHASWDANFKSHCFCLQFHQLFWFFFRCGCSTWILETYVPDWGTMEHSVEQLLGLFLPICTFQWPPIHFWNSKHSISNYIHWHWRPNLLDDTFVLRNMKDDSGHAISNIFIGTLKTKFALMICLYAEKTYMYEKSNT